MAKQSPLISLFFEALETINPLKKIPKICIHNNHNLTIGSHQFYLEKKPVIIALGKSAIPMANALKQVFTPPNLIITKFQNQITEQFANIAITGGHPHPNQSSFNAGERLIELIQKVEKDQLLILLLSGGGSSLVAAPQKGVTNAELIETNRILIKSGAPIETINTIRQKISRIKGGGLKRYLKGNAVVLTLSDIVDGDPKYVASAPLFTIDSKIDLNTLLNHYPLLKTVPKSVLSMIQKSNPNPHPDPPLIVIGDLSKLLNASEKIIQKQNIIPKRIIKPLCNNVTIIANQLFQQILTLKENQLLIAGGEPTVSIPQHITGKGGRAQHLALLILQKLSHHKITQKYELLIAGTDGDDGESGAAGVYFQWPKVKATTQEINGYLTTFNSYYFWEKHGALFQPGPTGSNVGDIIFIMKR